MMNINNDNPNNTVGEMLTARIQELRKESKSPEVSNKKDFVDKRPPFFTGESKYGKDTNVQLSDQAQAINLVLSDAQDEPEIDMEKVEKVKDALQRGSYKIDYDKVAKALLREDLFNSAL